MPAPTRPVRSFALVLLAASASILPAHAQDPAEVGERLKALFENQGASLAWSDISGDASEIVIEGATVKSEGEEEPIPLGSFTLSDVTEEDGAYRVGALTMDSYSVSEEGYDIAIDGLEVTGLVLPPADSTDPMDQVAMYDSADLAQLTVSKDGNELFAATGLHVSVTPPEGGEPLTFAGVAESFSADLSAVEDERTRAVADAMGYSTIEGSAQVAGSWNPSDGRAILEKYELAVEDAGTLSISVDMSGYTPEFMAALRETQAGIDAAPEGADTSAQGLAMLGLMQQLNFHGATIRFEDDSLTGKVLAYLAEQQGAQPSDIVNQAKALLPFALAQLNNPEFAAQVTAAVVAFLDDPQSLTVTAAPAQPVPFAMLAAGAMTAPQSLPQQLGVTVTANE